MLLHEGLRYQSGRGFGSLFAGLFRTLRPLVSMGLNAGKAFVNSDLGKKVGSMALDIGKNTLRNVAADLIEGKNPSEALDKGLETAKSTISSQIRGSGRKRRKRRSCKGVGKKRKTKFNLLDSSDGE